MPARKKAATAKPIPILSGSHPALVSDLRDMIAFESPKPEAKIGRDSPKETKASKSAPTRQQGQFLAYILEYMMRNEQGLAPTHAALQKFFNLTPPSVNSMLVRLEQRGFIARTPGQARGIRLVIAPDLIPSLERRFKF